jgi:GNAT superfamily N-acetyltransferase
MEYYIRQASEKDIDQIQWIRRAVKENILSNPELVSNEDCRIFITQRGRGWVAVSEELILGFAIADLEDDNIWALFVHPDHEKQRIGKQLHDAMLNWYFDRGKTWVWLSTDPATRAAGFYESQHWKRTGKLPNGEIKFEMTVGQWRDRTKEGNDTHKKS